VITGVWVSGMCISSLLSSVFAGIILKYQNHMRIFMYKQVFHNIAGVSIFSGFFIIVAGYFLSKFVLRVRLDLL